MEVIYRGLIHIVHLSTVRVSTFFVYISLRGLLTRGDPKSSPMGFNSAPMAPGQKASGASKGALRGSVVSAVESGGRMESPIETLGDTLWLYKHIRDLCWDLCRDICCGQCRDICWYPKAHAKVHAKLNCHGFVLEYPLVMST